MTDLQALRTQYRAQKATLFESLASCGTATRGVRTTLGKLAALRVGIGAHANFTFALKAWQTGGGSPGELDINF